MKISIDWLKDFVDINIAPEELAKKLTNSGMEVEEIIYLNEHLKHVVIGKITKKEQHPNADRLSVCQVDIGDKTVQILTAATNINENDLVPVALSGANLANGVNIKVSNMRGLESQGMFCSGEELGIDDSFYDGASVDGILILKENYPLGMSIEEAFGLNDVVLDINVTSNRPDCMSVLGIAREVSALLNISVKKQEIAYKTITEKITNNLTIEVKNFELCPRYIGAMVKDIKIEKSPFIIRRRLFSVGIKSINNIVDITNYVLIEYGQPMHAFDFENISNNKIIIRTAKEGETIKALDSFLYDLKDKNLIIADDKKPLVIAGVIGGVDSSINNNTKTIVFEAATFERATVRKTGRAFGIRTDSSARFEKGVDLASPEIGMKKALSLIDKYGYGKILSEVIDIKENDIVSTSIVVSNKKINSILGFNVEQEKITTILKNLGIENSINEDNITCIIPPFRSDIECDSDIAEEIIRMIGYEIYDNIEIKTLENSSYTIANLDHVLLLNRKIRQILSLRGYNEIISYSLCPENIGDRLNMSDDNKLRNLIKISNPISEDLNSLRTTMCHSILNNTQYNLKHGNKIVKNCETGRVYIPKELPLKELPEEINIFAFSTNSSKDDFFTVKGVVENILRLRDINYKLEYSRIEYLHPGISADVIDNNTNEIIASFGQINPKVAANYDITDKTFYAEINCDLFVKYPEKKINIKAISKYPIIERDLAFVVSEEKTVEELENSIKKSCGTLFYDIELFDIYRNKDHIGENNKSLAFKIKLSSNEKTLTDEEVTVITNKIQKDIKYKCNAELRTI